MFRDSEFTGGNGGPASQEWAKRIGSRIRVWRKELGLTGTDLAAAMGVSADSVYGYENGTRMINANDLPRLAGMLQMPVGHLYGDIVAYYGQLVRAEGEGGPSEAAGRTDAQRETLEAMAGLTEEEQTAVLHLARMLRGMARPRPAA